jgi:hypothetical protein
MHFCNAFESSHLQVASLILIQVRLNHGMFHLGVRPALAMMVML